MLKIATWNVNSLRVRLPQVIDWITAHQPDIFALQEIKLQDADFPSAIFTSLGYQAIFCGQKAYNGVAILSKNPSLDPITDFPNFIDPHRRVLATTIQDVRIINLYVPNGESLSSLKYTYKLDWLTRLNDFLQEQTQQFQKIIILGDFNIAPADIDVHDSAAWQNSVLFSAPEKLHFQNLLNLGFKDCFRYLSPQEKLFTWWDYRLNAFKRNLGLRIDHILTNDAFASKCQRCYIDATPRTTDRPSDHAIVVAEFEE